MRVIFIRHGESTANIGIPTDDMSKIGLTALGQVQATAIADHWTSTPTLIATSAFLRTHQTALPTMARFPDVAVEILPMEEFTYLEPSRWCNSTREERLPFVETYWRNVDPSFQDGPGAESFSMLVARVKMTLKHLSALHADSLVYAFSHGQFMQVLRMHLMHPIWSDQTLMANYLATNKQSPIHNTGLITIGLNQANWVIDGNGS